MKKLIKISDYYYVIDTDVEIKENDVVCNKYNNSTPNHIHIQKGIHNDLSDMKVIATNNPSISLPQITNPSDELELMIDKEIEVEFELLYCNNSCDETIEVAIIKPITKSEIIKNHCKEKGINFIDIPISKETYIDKINSLIQENIEYCNNNFPENLYVEDKSTILDKDTKKDVLKFAGELFNNTIKETSTNETSKFEPELFNDNSTVTFTVKEVREISTNLLKEYDVKLTENPYNKGNYVGFWDYMKNHFRSRFENSSKTNETLEEVAEKKSQNYVKYTDENFKFNLAEAYRLGFLSGYKHAESKMLE